MSKAASWLFLATLFVITFEKVHWEVAGTVNLSDVVSVLFLLSLVGVAVEGGHVGRVPRSVVIAAAFGAAFLAVYLIGFYDLDTGQALAQFFRLVQPPDQFCVDRARPRPSVECVQRARIDFYDHHVIDRFALEPSGARVHERVFERPQRSTSECDRHDRHRERDRNQRA